MNKFTKPLRFKITTLMYLVDDFSFAFNCINFRDPNTFVPEND